MTIKRDLAALEGRVHDVVVIGGGIAGAWAAWEGASRNLRVALIEADDFGQGTSWSSLKTAHGGLRHLQRLDLPGFFESVRERAHLLRVAPEIVRPLTFVVPASSGFQALLLRAGGLVNDRLSAGRNHHVRPDRSIPPTAYWSAEKLRSEFPFLDHHQIVGGLAWTDGQVTHTERLIVALLFAGAARELVACNHCALVDGEVGGEVRGGLGELWTVRVKDQIDDRTFEVRTKTIINATGSALGLTSGRLGEPIEAPSFVRGVNLVFAAHRDALTSTLALGVRDSTGRFLFAAPWMDRTIVGTFYDDGMRPLTALVDEAREATGLAFRGASFERGPVLAVHHGFVPGRSASRLLSRSRLIGARTRTLCSIVTAKYTTARATAEQALNFLAPSFEDRIGPSVSARTPLPVSLPEGDFATRLEIVRHDEMALSLTDAIRGRLIEGARGDLDHLAASGVDADHIKALREAIRPGTEA